MSLSILFAICLVPLLSAACTRMMQKVARAYQLLDVPSVTETKKNHHSSIPLGGGVAVMIAWMIGLVLVWSEITHGYVLPKYLFGFCIATIVLMIGGIIDDKKKLSPMPQLIAPIIAVCIIIASGIGISTITYPFGGTLSLEGARIIFFTWHERPYGLTLWADLFAFVWLMGMTYTTKLLDGIDGLVSSMAIVGAIFLALLSFTQRVGQPETGVIAVLLAGAFAGFLVFNWHPASIFLGEAGSLFAGFALGVLSIFSGAKIATTLLIFALPILDVAWVIARRLWIEKRSPFSGDRLHLHQRLLDVGFSQRQTVGILLALTVAFGACGLLFETRQKVVAFIIAVVCMCVLGFALSRKQKQ